MKKLGRPTGYVLVFLISILYLSSFSLVYSDDYPMQMKDTSLSSNTSGSIFPGPVSNFISTSFTKYVYTYLFSNLANFKIETDYGNILLLQDYQGSYMHIEGSPTRDDENWSLNYEKPFSDKFGLVVKQNWQFTSDSRNIGINQLMRLNGLAGLSYSPENDYKFLLLYGLENNNQLNLKSNGSAYAFSAEANNVFVENFVLNSNLYGNLINLNDGRNNRDINGQFRLFRSFSDSSLFNFNFNYRNLQNNLLGYSVQSGVLPIEVRNENNIYGFLNLAYPVSTSLSLNFDFSIQSLNVEREFKENLPDIPYSYFLRNVNQLELFGNFGFKLDIGKFYLNSKFGFSSRSEKNNLQEKFDGGDLNKYQNIESQRDNNSGRASILTNSMYFFNPSTYLIGTYFVQLFRYDTPSQVNFDDRDEFNNIINLKFFHRFSEYLTLQLEFENRQNHIVYIFSERSSLNNWNKVYRFAPQIYYRIGNFSLSPKLEVLANYTIYDYAKTSSSMNSISFRQISYTDSLYCKITDKISFHSLWKVKYSERGILYWSDFSESPQSGNYEFYGKAILRRNFAENIWIGSGVNFYRYSQIRLNNNSQIDYNLESLSPEISINYVYNKWTLTILGWYEFQTIKSSIKNQITNLSININLLF